MIELLSDLPSITEALSPFGEPIDDGCRELVYLLFSESAASQIDKRGMLMSDGILVTTHIEASSWLAEQQSTSTALYAVVMDRIDRNALESVCNAAHSPEASMAACGFAGYFGSLRSKDLMRVSPTVEDVREAVSDFVSMRFGGDDDAVVLGIDGQVTAWGVMAGDKADEVIVLSKCEEIRPWGVFRDNAAHEAKQAVKGWDKAGEWRNENLIESSPGVILEYARKNTGASLRLKRIVTDALLSRDDLPGKVRNVTVSSNTMTVKVGRTTYYFDVARDGDGWITGVDFKRPTGRESDVEFVKKAIVDGFKGASFQQMIEDACSGAKANLVMLDYVKLDGGHRTRMVEPYSYRKKGPLNRRYFYGWNVEEGGIRSYIVDQIKGARKTGIPFRPRFLVEIGSGQRLRNGHSYEIDKKVPVTVSDAMIKRGHAKYELSGGRGKIIKRLGHSVASPKPTKRKKKKS